jgi:hypothetical protein
MFKKLLFIVLIIFATISCWKRQYIPDMEVLEITRTFQNPIDKDLERPINNILQTGVKLCGADFKDTKIHFGEYDANDNILISKEPTDDSSSYAYASIHSININDDNQKDYILTSRCCPMGPCYTSYIFLNESNGTYKLIDEIPGEVIYYKKVKEEIIIKIQDNMISNLNYVGIWKNAIFTPLLVYSENHLEDKTYSSKDYSPIYHALQEVDNKKYVMLKPKEEEIERIINPLIETRNVSLIQCLEYTIQSDTDFRKLLKDLLYEFRWIEK